MSRPLSPALQKLIAKFREALPGKLQEIRALHLPEASAEDEALKDYYTAVHRLAGSAGSYGFPAVSQSARVLDRYLSDVLAGETGYQASEAEKLLDELAAHIADQAG